MVDEDNQWDEEAQEGAAEEDESEILEATRMDDFKQIMS